LNSRTLPKSHIDYKNVYPPKSFYHFPIEKRDDSPCMRLNIKPPTIRKAICREEYEHEEKPDLEREE
jgi:hypothetical protein